MEAGAPLHGDNIIGLTRFVCDGWEIEVKLFAPVRAKPELEEYICAFALSGRTLNYSGDARGIDSMQAVILALQKIGTFLQLNDEIDLAAIEWPNGKLEFPVFARLT